ncbi:hypothetical protein BV20DRAFT_322038 [Pilatotrama ljubarskyi]|nr:hypothetical protein BV20DRAFT_322038 [Pilatotrama ljubarskyi]
MGQLIRVWNNGVAARTPRLRILKPALPVEFAEDILIIAWMAADRPAACWAVHSSLTEPLPFLDVLIDRVAIRFLNLAVLRSRNGADVKLCQGIIERVREHRPCPTACAGVNADGLHEACVFRRCHLLPDVGREMTVSCTSTDPSHPSHTVIQDQAGTRYPIGVTTNFNSLLSLLVYLCPVRAEDLHLDYEMTASWVMRISRILFVTVRPPLVNITALRLRSYPCCGLSPRDHVVRGEKSHSPNCAKRSLAMLLPRLRSLWLDGPLLLRWIRPAPPTLEVIMVDMLANPGARVRLKRIDIVRALRHGFLPPGHRLAAIVIRVKLESCARVGYCGGGMRGIQRLLRARCGSLTGQRFDRR